MMTRISYSTALRGSPEGLSPSGGVRGKAPAAGGRLRPCLLVVGLCLLIKWHFAGAGAAELDWLLKPVSLLVSAVTGMPFYQAGTAGYLNEGGNVLIAPACSGLNFFIILLAAGGCLVAGSGGSWRRKSGWLAAASGLAYAWTLAANTVRIVIAVVLYQYDVNFGPFTAERLHRMEGAVVYAVCLCLFALLVSAIAGRRTNVSFPTARRLLIPLGCYLLFTVAVPLANGGYAAASSLFVEHVLTVTAISMAVTAGMYALFRAKTCQRNSAEDRMSAAKPRILIVEDEPAIIDAIQYALETEGCETLAVLNGEDGLAALGRESIDLVVLDVGLPDINGMDLLKNIRAASDVPVVFLTARSSDIDRVLGLELGGDDYIVKPFSPRELAARVRAVLRRARGNGSGARTGAAGQTGPWQVDTEKRSISYHGARLELSRYEYNLLMVFLDRPGHVLTRDQLMDAAWDEPEMSTDRTVDAHIKNLRAKLKVIRPDDDPIVTHRGVGYALKENA